MVDVLSTNESLEKAREAFAALRKQIEALECHMIRIDARLDKLTEQAHQHHRWLNGGLEVKPKDPYG